MGGKKKWAKGRVREKINNLVVLDQKLHDRLFKEIPKVRDCARACGCCSDWDGVVWRYAVNRYCIAWLIHVGVSLALVVVNFVLQLKVVTINTMTEKLKVNGSLARACIRELVSLGHLKPVFTNNRISVWTRTVEPAPKAEGDEPKKGKKGKKSKKKKGGDDAE